ncbi:MAG: hypothetical protein K9H64_03435 [Bacteroidales bacterium]|nr:hypothetical protein [Bacteroidales bacterium]MCF8456442.1 hypothetical protein [Bacteroidales bacterium]
MLPGNIQFTINGQPVLNNDFWIGVFYTESDGGLTCGGYRYWLGNSTTIAAFGENYLAQTFRTEEEFIFKIFILNGQDSLFYDVMATFITTMPQYNTYLPNGMSGLELLSATSPASYKTQRISLPINWSIFSTYLIPTESDISVLLNPIINNLIIVKDGDGQTFWPAFGLNMIGDIEPGRGYQIKILNADSLFIKGAMINLNTFELELPAGWSIMGYILTQPKSAEDVLQPIVENIIIAKDYNGNVYWPAFGLNMMGNMNPGQGYLIKTTLSDTLIFSPGQNPAALCPTSISDFDGNQYSTVLIGHQCWMAENLITSHYSNGTIIPYITSNSDWNNLSETDKAYCYYNNSLSNGESYGALYSWPAAMNGEPASISNLNRVQGVCPAGWYLPAESDWEELADFINLQNGYYERNMWFWKGVGGHLKSTTNWYYYGIGSDDYGFSGHAGGKRDYDGQFSLLSESGYWWTASETNSDLARVRKLFYRNNNLFNFDHKKENGFSVRCLLDTCTVYPFPAADAGSDTLSLLDTFVVLQGNTPIIGTGQWSIISGAGGILSDGSNPGSIFNGLENHHYSLVWSINNACGYTGDTLHVYFQCQTLPTQADAGTDQINLFDTITYLQANIPVIGNGNWSIVSGTGGFLLSPANPYTQFSGMPAQTYVLVWTIANYCSESSDTVVISFICEPTPTQALAGPDQMNLSDTFTNLQANTPLSGTGTWYIISGIGGVIAETTNPYSLFTGLVNQVYTLVWSICTPCATASDTVSISFQCLTPPSQAYAGPDQINLPDTFTTLQADTPNIGQGHWEIISGIGGQISNDLNPSASFSGLQGHEYILTWSVENNSLCEISVDTAVISFLCFAPPNQANAGTNQLNLIDTFTILQANLPVSGLGTWSLISGTGGEIMDVNNPLTQFNGLALHEYHLVWKIENVCWSTFDTVTINFSCGPPPTPANAGQDQINLVDTFTSLSANSPIFGTETWSILLGIGGYFQNAGNPTSQFYGFAGNQYHLVWTIANFCGQTSDTVIVSFAPDTTSFYCGLSSVSDIDGNYYTTTQIGNQCWMAKNLNTGNFVTTSTSQSNNSVSEKYCYGNIPAKCGTLGGLYQWEELMDYSNIEGTQGICPPSWHVPSDLEWYILENFVDSTVNNPNATGYRGTTVDAILLEGGYSGLDIIFSGLYYQPNGAFYGAGSANKFGNYATSSENGINSWIRHFNENNVGVNRDSYSKLLGNSVRCIKD